MSLRRSSFSFRAKLVLAMVLLVGGVSLSTLYLARLALQRTYGEALQQQFRSQIEFFVERQATRLAEIQRVCSTLAASEALRAALLTGEAGQTYAAARTALVAVSQENPSAAPRGNFPQAGPPQGRAGEGFSGPPGEGRGPGRMRGMGAWMGFLRVLDAQGNVLPQPGGFAGGRGGSPDGRAGRFDDQLSGLARTMHSWKSLEVAYLAPDNDTEGRVFLEVVAAPMVEAGSGKVLGAVVLGAPMFDQAEEMRDLSEILTGFWLDGRLHTHTIPEPLREPLAQRLRADAVSEGSGERDFRLRHDGQIYRVFLRLLNPDSPFPRTYQVKLYSLEGALRSERRLQSGILSIGLAVLVLGIGVSLVLANRLTLSVRELDSATAEVLRGNFQIKVPVRSRDDVGRLVDSFNQMTEGLAQKERYRRVLNLVAGARVASELVNTEQLPVGEFRTVTVLFCDVRQFTARTQGMPPDQVIALLNEHMTALTKVVSDHHGLVDKFVGDLIMAVFGAPLTQANDAANAVACARQMLRVRASLNRDAAHPLEIGIGIATGGVIAGLMGSADRANYTVLGLSVNLASRLCAEARAGQILVDQETHARLADTLAARRLPPLPLKGFREPVEAWEVTPLV